VASQKNAYQKKWVFFPLFIFAFGGVSKKKNEFFFLFSFLLLVGSPKKKTQRERVPLSYLHICEAKKEKRKKKL